MEISNDIIKWEAPKWHKDFGDSQKELNILKRMCLGLIENFAGFRFELDCYEEGYMRVIILREEVIGEMQVTDVEAGEVGFFLENGTEGYVTNPEDIKKDGGK